MAERMRPAREPTAEHANPSRVQRIQRHRIQGAGIDAKPQAIDPDRDGGGHGDLKESDGGERDRV